MGFIGKNIRPLVLVLFVIISELIWLPFSEIIHHDEVSLGVVLYHVFAQIGYVSFLPSIFLYKIEKNIHSKGIYLGLVFWNILEVLQEFNTLLKLNIDFLNKSASPKSDILQIIFIIFGVCLTYMGFKKWRTSSQY